MCPGYPLLILRRDLSFPLYYCLYLSVSLADIKLHPLLRPVSFEDVDMLRLLELQFDIDEDELAAAEG